MVLVTGSIGLGIRERTQSDDTSAYSAAALQQWSEDLPMANIAEVSKRVYHRIKDTNGLLLPVATRLAFHQHMENHVKFVLDSLKKHYLGQSASLNEKQRKIANLCQAMQSEQAIGYKSMLEDLFEAEDYTSKHLPHATAAALFHLHAIQVRSYELYSDLRKGIWHELHALYQLAEQNQFHEQTIELQGHSFSAQNIYLRAVLIATTNPNQIRQRDVENTSIAMGMLARHASMTDDPEADFDFAVNLHSDAPPFHRSLIKDGIKAHYRGIRVVRLVGYLQEQLKTTEVTKRSIKLNDSLLRHLLRSWGTMATRSFARTPGSGHIQVSIGLGASHYLIHQEMFGEDDTHFERPNLARGDIISSLEGSLKDAVILHDDTGMVHSGSSSKATSKSGGADSPKLKTEDMWENLFVKKEAQEPKDDPKKAYEFMDKSSAGTAKRKYDFNDAAIINISPGGYCLKLEGGMPSQTQTGEIIGLLETDDDGNHVWNIGNIRWLKNENDGHILQLGVQLMAPNARPVLGQVRTSQSDDHNFQRCLLLPPLPGLGQPASVLTSPTPFDVGQKVRLKNDFERFDVKLTQLLSSGISFRQFAYEKLSVTPVENSKANDSSDDLDDNIWDII